MSSIFPISQSGYSTGVYGNSGSSSYGAASNQGDDSVSIFGFGEVEKNPSQSNETRKLKKDIDKNEKEIKKKEEELKKAKDKDESEKEKIKDDIKKLERKNNNKEKRLEELARRESISGSQNEEQQQ